MYINVNVKFQMNSIEQGKSDNYLFQIYCISFIFRSFKIRKIMTLKRKEQIN